MLGQPPKKNPFVKRKNNYLTAEGPFKILIGRRIIATTMSRIVPTANPKILKGNNNNQINGYKNKAIIAKGQHSIKSIIQSRKAAIYPSLFF